MNLILSALLFTAPAFAETHAGAANTTTYTDSQIVDVVKTANKGEIDSSKHAKSHSKNKEVQAFAKEMIDHHNQSNDETKKLMSKLKLKGEESDLTKDLEASAKEKMTSMKDLKGADYDKAYIQAQIDMHESVLSTLDNKLLPSAKNTELKMMLEKTRETVASHLDEAKKINASL